jgi:hypothetical protein
LSVVFTTHKPIPTSAIRIENYRDYAKIVDQRKREAANRIPDLGMER